MIGRRRQWRLKYRDLFTDVPGVTLFGEPSGVDGGATCDNFWLTSILVDADLAGFTSDDLRYALADRQIEARPLWKPMHVQPVFAGSRAFVDGMSEQLFRTGLSLPSGSVLDDDEWDRVAAALTEAMRGACVSA